MEILWFDLTASESVYSAWHLLYLEIWFGLFWIFGDLVWHLVNWWFGLASHWTWWFVLTLPEFGGLVKHLLNMMICLGIFRMYDYFGYKIWWIVLASIQSDDFGLASCEPGDLVLHLLNLLTWFGIFWIWLFGLASIQSDDLVWHLQI